MTTLVTGASGFIGSAVVRALLQAGHEVRVLLRARSDRRNIEGLPVSVTTGDLVDRASLERAVEGCEALFHVAADYRIWVPNPDDIYRINVAGTRDLMLAAGAAGVKRVVYTSSVATLGLNGDRSPSNEDTSVTLAEMIGHYKRSKFLAEQEVHKLVQEAGLPAVIVNPSAPVGPRDIKPTPTGRLVLDAVRGRMPAYVDTGLNVVHVDDVGIGHVLAFEREYDPNRNLAGHRSDQWSASAAPALAAWRGAALCLSIGDMGAYDGGRTAHQRRWRAARQKVHVFLYRQGQARAWFRSATCGTGAARCHRLVPQA
jgi:dihydroflavonol-4-reductase